MCKYYYKKWVMKEFFDLRKNRDFVFCDIILEVTAH